MRAGLELPRFKGHAGWEFTDLGSFDWTLSRRPARARATRARSSAPRRCSRRRRAPSLGQVDGLVVESRRGRPDGVVVLALSVARRAASRAGRAAPRHDRRRRAGVFIAANDADWTGGAFVYVPRGVRVEAPILLTAVTAAAGTALHRRVLIVLDEGAEAEVWEQYLSGRRRPRRCSTPSSSSSSARTRRLRYVCGQDLNEKSWIFGAQRAEVARDGKLDWVAPASAPRAARCAWRPCSPARAPRPRSPAPTRRTRASTSTSTRRRSTRAPNTISDLAFRGILAGRSTAVWRGMIKVDPGAQQTDAFQECRNLLLSKRAHVDAIPGLEILANDVRCTHAAAIAQIDKEQLFYLRSRGLPEPQRAAPGDRGLHGRAGRALRGGRDPRARSRARSSAGSPPVGLKTVLRRRPEPERPDDHEPGDRLSAERSGTSLRAWALLHFV